MSQLFFLLIIHGAVLLRAQNITNQAVAGATQCTLNSYTACYAPRCNTCYCPTNFYRNEYISDGVTYEGCTCGIQFYAITYDKCTLCDFGYIPLIQQPSPTIPTSATACIACSPGYFVLHPGETSCTSCPAGSFSPLASRYCPSCPEGMYSDIIAASTCKNCPAGKFSDISGGTVCSSCPIGSYSNAAGSSVCFLCPPGTYSNLLGATLCFSCSAGSYSNPAGRTACLSCSQGTFSNSVGATACLLCSAGSYSDVMGRTICLLCNQGKYSATLGTSSASACLICPGGTYAGSGMSACVSCLSGKYSSELGAISSSICISCTYGTYSSSPATVKCNECNIGAYTTSLDTTSSLGCIACLAGRYLNRTGLSSCIACPPGSFSVSTGSSTCQSCLQGKYSVFAEQSSQSTCLDCPATQCIIPGQYSTCGNNTQGGCMQCQNLLQLGSSYYYIVSPVTGYNPICPAKVASRGSYRNCTNPRAPMQIFFMTFKSSGLEFGSFCMFQNIIFNQPYYRCMAQDFSWYYVWWQESRWVGSAILGDLSTAVMGPSADGNSYLSGESQAIIALYSNLQDTSAAWEISCSPGTYASAEGSTACTQASPGFHVPGVGSALQIACSAGLYSYAGASSCTATCPAGTYRAASGSQCTLTSPGDYSNGTGILLPCPRGTFSSITGATVCINCAAGSYNSGTGMDSSAKCLLCAQGSYTTSVGRSDCIGCSSGKYNTVAGSTSCLACTTACPAGKQIQSACTPTSDAFCMTCTLVANCVYVAGSPCGNNTNPNCLCSPGFELIAGQCQQCKPGFFRGLNSSSLPCTPWNTSRVCSPGNFLANGTRFSDSACLPGCPTIPSNSTSKGAGCQWGCNAGYNNTVIK